MGSGFVGAMSNPVRGNHVCIHTNQNGRAKADPACKKDVTMPKQGARGSAHAGLKFSPAAYPRRHKRSAHSRTRCGPLLDRERATTRTPRFISRSASVAQAAGVRLNEQPEHRCDSRSCRSGDFRHWESLALAAALIGFSCASSSFLPSILSTRDSTTLPGTRNLAIPFGPTASVWLPALLRML